MGTIGQGLADVARSFNRKQWVQTALGVAGIAVGIVAAFSNDTAAAVVAALSLFLVVAITVYVLYMRERYGGIYEIVSSEVIWDLKDAPSARVTKKNRVRFIQNNVLAIPDYIWGPGTTNVNYRCHPGEKVAEFDDGSRRCMVIALDRMYKRNQELDIAIERDVPNAFGNQKEWIELKPLAGTPDMSLTVKWPANKPASKVELTVSNERRNKQTVTPVDNEVMWDDGRQRLSRMFAKPSPDEVYRIDWEW